MKEEYRKLYQEYRAKLDEAGLWTYESFEGFWNWLLTGKLTP